MVALPSVNMLAVLVAAVVSFLTGGAYWAFFTRAWSAAQGLSGDSVRLSPLALGVAFVTRIVVAYVLASFAAFAHAVTLLGGAEIGALAWLGFVLPPALGQAAFSRQWKAAAIGQPEVLIGLVVMGMIVGVWQ